MSEFFWQPKICFFMCNCISFQRYVTSLLRRADSKKNHISLSAWFAASLPTLSPSHRMNKTRTINLKMKAERQTYYLLLKLSAAVVCLFCTFLMPIFVLLQYGVQQGGCGPTSWQRLQMLQQWRAGWHGAGNVPQCSRTSRHTQSALPPGCIHTLTIRSLCLSLCVFVPVRSLIGVFQRLFICTSKIFSCQNILRIEFFLVQWKIIVWNLFSTCSVIGDILQWDTWRQ